MADNASNLFETGLLALILRGTSIAGIADNDQSSPLTAFGIALHTASPGESGEANANEATYTGYTRVAYPRDTTGWTIAGSSSATASAAPTTNITFPQATAGSETITHWSISGSTVTASTGTVFMYGTLTPNINVSAGVTPRITTASAITII
jgi:hypothetical protein